MLTMELAKRYALEGVLINSHYPDFKVMNPAGNPYYEGWISNVNFCNSYKLRIQTGPLYPFEQPKLLILHPKVIPLYGGRGLLNSIGPSHAFHTYSSEEDGTVSICHTDNWSPDITIVRVIFVGYIWLAALEIHQVTGKTIADIIDVWKQEMESINNNQFYHHIQLKG